MKNNTPLLSIPREGTSRVLGQYECGTRCGSERTRFSFFCEACARQQRPVSVALMVGGMLLSSTGEVLGEGRLSIRQW